MNHVSQVIGGTKVPERGTHVGGVRTSPLRGRFCLTIEHKHLLRSQGLQMRKSSVSCRKRWPHHIAAMSRSFYVDSLIIKDSARPVPLNEHPGQDFLIPLGVHSPGVMAVAAPVCPSRKNGTFCVCPLCVTSHIHSPRSSIPLLKGQFPSGEMQYCQRIGHQQSAALTQHGALAQHGHTPVGAPTYSVTDTRRFHCLSIGKLVTARQS